MAGVSKNSKMNSTTNDNTSKSKMVATSVCEACKDKCESGINYIERMKKPGAIGRGVACNKK